METVTYNQTSPYYNTSMVANGSYLGLWNQPIIPAANTDKLITINQIYNLRPDLLAHDLYGDSRLWWVFAMRNPNTLRDPLGDFVTGTQIFLPDSGTLKAALGV